MRNLTYAVMRDGLQHAEVISGSCLSKVDVKAVIQSLIFFKLSFIFYLCYQ